MIYLGAFAVISGVFLLWRAYCSYLSAELSDTRAFLRALSDYRERMKCYLEPPSAWAASYADDRLESTGFLPRLVNGEELTSAYLESRAAYYLSERADGVLTSCFSRLGEGYLDTELEIIESSIASLAEEERQMSEEIKARERAAGALLGAFAVGIVILII